MAYNWQQIPRAQTSGHVYEITDGVEWTSPVPDGGTREAAVESYKLVALDTTTQRRCLFLDCMDGNQTGPNQHFWMPSGTFDAGDEG